MKKVWLPRILRDKNTGKEIFTYIDSATGIVTDVVSDQMSMDNMVEFLISYLSAKVLKLKEHAKILMKTLKFEIEGTEDNKEISDKEFVSVKVTMKDVEGLNFKQYTKDDVEDNEN